MVRHTHVVVFMCITAVQTGLRSPIPIIKLLECGLATTEPEIPLCCATGEYYVRESLYFLSQCGVCSVADAGGSV